jgi:PAS domain S-box-containing protein
MLQVLGSRLSVAQRVLLVAACAAPPVIVLLILFLGQSERDYRFTTEELRGTAYITQIWSVVVAGGETGPAPSWRAEARTFGAERQAGAFLAAPPRERPSRGADFIQAVADGSNLTLDSDLNSFYAMDAATAAMPRLLAVAMSPEAAAGDPIAIGRAQSEEQAALRDLRGAIDRLPTAEARSALVQEPRQIATAFDAFMRNPKEAAERRQLVLAVDTAWRVDNRELGRLLDSRRRVILERLFASLSLVAATLVGAALVAVALTRALGKQLKALLQTMDRLNAGDTDVQVPYLGHPTETGRIAATLEACRRGMIETAEERRRAEQANAAVRESEARYRLLADNTADMIIQYDLDFRPLYVSPSMKSLGYEPEVLLAEGIVGIVHPDNLALVAERRAAAKRGEALKAVTGQIRRADGVWLWIESTITPMFDGAGGRVGFISTLRDISERKLAEQALIDSEARYRMLADNATDVLVRYGPDSRVEYVSPAVRQWGYKVEDFLGTPAGLFVHPDDQQRVALRREALEAGESVDSLEYRIRRADGEWVWVESNPAAIRDETGELLGVVLVIRDISKRRAAETALVESEARYRMLAENISDVLLRYDADQRISYVSPSVRQWGYKPADFLGKPAGHFVHPEDQDRIALRRAALLAGELAPRSEARILRADGKWAWVESSPATIRGPDQEVIGVVLILRDISQRKAAETAVIESEARYRMLADNTSDIIQVFDPDGVVEYVSPSVRQLGYEPEFFVGRPTALLVDREDLPEVARRRQDLLSGRPVAPLESRVRTADGRTVWLESRPSPILDEHGKLRAVVNVMRDVTDRKNAESALQELNLELRRVARASALGAFAASLAHEINQPLAAAAVNGEAALRWLSAEPVNAERGLQATRRAVEAVRRAADVVGRLRALVTKEEPNRALFDAHDAVGEVLLLTAPEAERSSVTVRTQLEAAQPLISGDRVQFQQVIINLVLNAIEAMREVDGERLLQVGSRDTPEGLEVFVEDRGPGVETDKESLIFESMFTTKIGGTGLGLAIAKSIVESHGGAIAMTPASPHGAVFSVRLPRLAAGAGLRSA